MLRSSAASIVALGGAVLIGCGDEDEPGTSGTGTPASAATGTPTEAPGTAASGIKRGGSATVAIDATGVTTDIDPHGQGATAHNNMNAFSHVYKSLVDWAPGEYVLEPEMAESWENPDPTQFIFRLRQGVQFHHGTEMVADDVVFSYERQFMEGVIAPYKSWLTMVDSVEAPDDYTVVYTLQYPFINFPSIFAAMRPGGIVSREFTTQNGNDLTTVASGTGPWKLKEMVPDERLSFERSDTYFRMGDDGQSLPYMDELTYVPIIESSSAVAAVRTGEVMWARVSSTDAEILSRESDLRLFRTPQGWHRGWSVYPDREPMEDVRVRMALNLAIDRQDLINKVPHVGYTVMSVPWYTLPDYGIAPADMPAHYSAVDVAEATKLLAAAGLSELDLEVHDTGPDTSFTGASAEVLREQWRAIGVNLTNVVHPPGSFSAQRDGFPGHFFSAPWTQYPDPDFYVYNWYHTDTSERSFKPKWSDPELDSMMETARTETDLAARVEAYRAIQLYMDETVPQLSFYDAEYNEAVHNRLQGYTAHPQSRSDIGMTNAWIDA